MATHATPRAHAGFTLVEVMVATAVLLFAIVSVVALSQRGMHALDSARRLSAASQLMQSELERVRLLNWTQLQALQDCGDTSVPVGPPGGYTCARTIQDVKPDMKEIVVTASWRNADGTTHSSRLITRYGKVGLNDYFYTAH